MKKRYRIFRRGETYYVHDQESGKQHSLWTKDKQEALRVLHARYEAHENPTINLQIARAYLHVADATYATRTWKEVFGSIINTFKPTTESFRRWTIAAKDKAFSTLQDKVVAETRAEDFLRVLQVGTVSTNVYLRRVQNYAIGMNWLMVPILPRKLFPAVRHASKRGISQFEHARIIEREQRETSSAVLPLSACLNIRMISSVLCRFCFMCLDSSCPLSVTCFRRTRPGES